MENRDRNPFLANFEPKGEKEEEGEDMTPPLHD